MSKLYFRLAALLLFIAPVFTLAQTPVTLQLTEATQSENSKQMNLLIKSEVLLNVYEATLLFNPLETLVQSIDIPSVLCDEQFVIEQRIDNAAGEVYIACGTLTPYTSPAAYESLLALSYISTATSSLFLIGEKTNFHQHDGRGTPAAHVVTSNTF